MTDTKTQTPRTDAYVAKCHGVPDYLSWTIAHSGTDDPKGLEFVCADDSRKLETELNAATAELERVKTRCAELETECREADRESGKAKRELGRYQEEAFARDRWLHKAKLEWGVNDEVSFDVVWAECLTIRSELSTARAEIKELKTRLSAMT